MKEKQITTKSRTARQNRTFRLSDYESRKLSEGAKAARMNESSFIFMCLWCFINLKILIIIR